MKGKNKRQKKKYEIQIKCPRTVCGGIQGKDVTRVLRLNHPLNYDIPIDLKNKLEYADMKTSQKEYENAIIQYDLIIMKKPSNIRAIINRSFCQNQIQQHQEAAFFYSNAISQINQIRDVKKRND